MNPIRKKELTLYVLAWTLVFALAPLVAGVPALPGHHMGISWQSVFSVWLEVLPFLLLFVAHDTAAQAWLLQKKCVTYALATAVLLGVFAWLCFRTGQQSSVGAPGMAGMADGFRPAPADGPHSAPAHGHLPLRPEVMKLMIGILVIGVNLGVKAFLSAIYLARRTSDTIPVPAVPSIPATLQFKSDYKTVKVAPDDIRYVESMGEYVKIYRTGIQEPLVVLYSLKRLMGQLPAGHFLRIHRSYIVNLGLVREASATSVTLDGGETLPIGESYRLAFRNHLRGQ